MRNWAVDTISIQGYAHKSAGKECQDHSVSWQNKYYDAAIVCDGHGGDKYFRSDAGAYLACEAGKKLFPHLWSIFGKIRASESNSFLRKKCAMKCLNSL